jgi:hypothetical protein
MARWGLANALRMFGLEKSQVLNDDICLSSACFFYFKVKADTCKVRHVNCISDIPLSMGVFTIFCIYFLTTTKLSRFLSYLFASVSTSLKINLTGYTIFPIPFSRGLLKLFVLSIFPAFCWRRNTFNIASIDSHLFKDS